ncbi:MAG TPA: CocE/NonD family hydrolase [Chitinophagales bacterium]|nr:CocE/NonD family hydrolase [Chitinophagales bacterium]
MIFINFFNRNFAFALLLFYSAAFAGNGNEKSSHEKVSDLGVYIGYSEPVYKGYSYHSCYVMMPDSVKLAVDVFLPKKAKQGEKFPAILYLTRYGRSLQAKVPFRWLKDPVLVMISEKEIEFFTSYGYACVIVDVRGSGASFGERTMEFSPKEVKDGYDIVEWIIHQPWSDGTVGSTGVSYVGTTAELLLVNKHPAVKACIPRSSIFDLYNHMMFPGGVRQGPFIRIWENTTNSLDNNDFAIFGKKAERLLSGINPVDGDRHKKFLKEALALHQGNFQVYDGLAYVNFRDDRQPGTGLCSNDYSIHSNRRAIEESGTPIYRIGGWYDGALTKSVIEGMLNTSNTKRILIGPWDHGPRDNASPFSPAGEVNFNVHAEMLRFFDHYLKGIDNRIDKEKKINYFTIGEEKWKQSDTWNFIDENDITFHLSADRRLVTDAEAVTEGDAAYIVDYSANSGNTSRWNSQTPLYKNGPTRYPDRREQSDKLLNFTSFPFSSDVEITGQPIVDLYLSADAADAVIFCYVEDVAPEGTITYVTEGLFRAQHRKISDNVSGYQQAGPYHSFKKEDAMPLTPGETARLQFDMMPISYLFRAGHSLRFSIAGADSLHFDLPAEKPSSIYVSCSEQYPSRILLPVVDR